MSGNSTLPKPDRRVRRTRDTLGDALLSLMREKVFDEISVQNVLDRAGVGRSTFYTHYRDKNDLFLSDLEDFFGAMSTLLTRTGASPDRIAPVRELCAHMAERPDIYSSILASGKMNDAVDLGHGFFARSIEQRLLLSKVNIQPAHAHALAGAMFSLIFWWVDHGKSEQPEAIDALFHQLVWTGLRPVVAPAKDPSA